MLKQLSRLRLRLGDFWWYTLMIFCAQRVADALNVFVGLYLVPKYVAPEELGAVMPLTQFANLLAIPAGVFAATFRQELTSLALHRDFGRMKSLMRGVFIATTVFFVVAILASRLILPVFLSRIRIVEGSLGFVILAAAFIGTIAPVYTNALQSLKKFKAYSLLAILGAPIRCVTMLLMMPLRAITGYFVGQTASPVFSIGATLFALRKELRVKAQRYWTTSILGRFTLLFVMFGASALITGIVALFEATVIRGKLPALDSAAYYMVTRFSDLTVILAGTLMLTIFPFAAEIAAEGRDRRPLMFKCMTAVAVLGIGLGVFFACFGASILRMLPHAEAYVSYAWAIPCMIGVMTLNQLSGIFTTAELAANRFGFMAWNLPLHLAYAITLYLCRDSIDSLQTMILWMGGFQFVRLICTFIALRAISSSPSAGSCATARDKAVRQVE